MKKDVLEEESVSLLSNSTQRGMINMILQNGEEMSLKSQKVLYENIEQMVQGIKNGDIDMLLTVLTGNILQLQLFNSRVTQNLMGTTGKELKNFEKLSNIQLKIMQETRKSVMAVNEITNPKRTTFIKEANQHNHLHQNSEKKDENENELQKQLDASSKIPDATLLEVLEMENEKK